MLTLIKNILTGTDDKIAVTRTLAPVLWAAIVSTFGNFGLDISGLLSDAFGVSESVATSWAVLLVYSVLYLVGKFAPVGVLERLLLIIPVQSTSYDQGDGSLSAVPNVEI